MTSEAARRAWPKPGGPEQEWPNPMIDPHDPTGQAIVEKWLLAYKRGEAKPGDCKMIADEMKAQAVRATWEEAANMCNHLHPGWVCAPTHQHGLTGYAPECIAKLCRDRAAALRREEGTG